MKYIRAFQEPRPLSLQELEPATSLPNKIFILTDSLKCSLCDKDEESLEHILLICVYHVPNTCQGYLKDKNLQDQRCFRVRNTGLL